MDELTWRDRLVTPYEIVHSAAQSVRYDFTQPHLIETSLGHSRDDGPSFRHVTGPWWLALADRALRTADTLTGHWWCNRGLFGGPGLMTRQTELLERHGTEVRASITDDEARAYCAAMDWNYWPDEAAEDDQNEESEET